MSVPLSAIKAGDRIAIDDLPGTVAFSSITDSYSRDYPKRIWSGEAHYGIMFEQDDGTLIFHDAENLLANDLRIERL